MNTYSETVARIADDYLDRVREHLHAAPPAERTDFLRELHSHIYEAYTAAPHADEVARILAVLRNLGEPAEVASERTGVPKVAAARIPFAVAIVASVFAIPLALAGTAALTAAILAYCAAIGWVFAAGAAFMLLTLIRMYQPQLWAGMLNAALRKMHDLPASVIESIDPATQALVLILLASALIAVGVILFRGGMRMLARLRALRKPAFQAIRKLASRVDRPRRTRRQTTAASMAG